MSFLNDLNPEQKKAVEAVTGPVMIIAGAGSGKTRVLTYRVAHLITLGIRPESILGARRRSKPFGLDGDVPFHLCTHPPL